MFARPKWSKMRNFEDLIKTEKLAASSRYCANTCVQQNFPTAWGKAGSQSATENNVLSFNNCFCYL